MVKKWFVPVGTRTTPRKQSAIRHARAGTMETRHLNYVLMKYGRALLYPVRNLLLKHYGSGKIIGFDLHEFIENCIKDAFIRIKEYDPQHRFRSFLTSHIVLPALSQTIRAAKLERKAILEYLRRKEAAKRFEQDYRYSIAQEFVKDALRELKKQDPIKYEVFCMRSFDDLAYKEIYKRLKESYPLSILSISSESGLRQIYQRAEKKAKHLFRELIRNKQYVDDDLPFNRHIIKKLHAETTKKA